MPTEEELIAMTKLMYGLRWDTPNEYAHSRVNTLSDQYRHHVVDAVLAAKRNDILSDILSCLDK